MIFFNTILNIILPVNCLSCGKKDSDLCINCISKFPSSERESPEWVFPLYDYRYPFVKKAIRLLKYKNKKRLANIFAENMYGRILEEFSDLSKFENFKEPILIPIPLAKKRLRERGFNQSLLLCEKIIKLDKLNNNKHFKLEKNILIKPRDTEHQARLSDRGNRLLNITGSFAVKNIKKIRGKNVILIDDVTTTGATLSEARKTLKKAGARKIIAFTLAH